MVDPDEVVVGEPARCADCGGELVSGPGRCPAALRRVPRRVAAGTCGTVTAGASPGWVVGLAQADWLICSSPATALWRPEHGEGGLHVGVRLFPASVSAPGRAGPDRAAYSARSGYPRSSSC